MAAEARPGRLTPRAQLAVVLVTAFAASLLANLIFAPGVHDDTHFYLEAARSLAAGEGYAAYGQLTALWVPGWPWLMSLALRVYDNPVSLDVLRILLHTAAAGATWALARRIVPERAVVAGLLVALWPDLVLYSTLEMSENLFVPLFALVLLALIVWRERQAWTLAALAGGLLAASTLVRPVALLFPLVALVWMLPTRRWSSLAAFGLAFVVCLMPWMARNAYHGGEFSLSSHTGTNLIIAVGPEATGGYSWDPIRAVVTGERLAAAAGVPAEFALDRELRSAAISHVAANPGSTLALLPQKLVRLAGRDGLVRYGLLVEQTPGDESAPIVERDMTVLEQRVFGATMPLPWLSAALRAVFVVLAFWALIGSRSTGAALLSWVVVYWLILHVTIGFGEPRFMTAIVPAMVVAGLSVRRFPRSLD